MLKLPMLLGTTVVVALLLVSGSAQAQASLCRQSGYFALVDNTPEFYVCRASPAGGFSLQFLRCSAGSVFSSKAGHCTEVADLSLMARDDGDIANATIPPSHEDESSSAKPVEETTPTPIPTAAPFSDTTAKPDDATTAAPISTEKPSSDTTEKPDDATTAAPISTEKPSSDITEKPDDATTAAPISTDDSSTDDSSTDDPSTDDPSTDDPSTDNPSTDEPSTDDPSTDDSSTDDSSTDDPSTDDPSTDNPSTDEPSSDTTDSDTTDDGSATAATPVLDCPSKGFFPMDDHCDRFIICFDNGNGLQSAVFKCPENMQFDPFNSVCSADYDCTAP